MRYRSVPGFITQKKIQAAVHDPAHKLAPVTPHDLNPFCSHFPRSSKTRPGKPRVALLVHQQIRIVNLFELHFDRRPKLLAHNISSLAAKIERTRKRSAATERDHN